jgi:DNA-binding GntR family transcriptional regulator
MAAEVYQVLRQRILMGELQPGAQVRPEHIAQELGVSRTPVMEAINRLAHEELVALRPSRGTFVSDFCAERVIALFDVRLMMEHFSAEPGMRRVTREDVGRLARLLDEEERLIAGDTVSDFLVWHRLNREFHQACIDLAGNIVLSDLHARLNVDIVMARAYQLAILRMPQEVHAEHHAVLAAYAAGDTDALRAASAAHLARGRSATIELMKRRAAI